jgi:hypothetical protein
MSDRESRHVDEQDRKKRKKVPLYLHCVLICNFFFRVEIGAENIEEMMKRSREESIVLGAVNVM